MQSSLRPAFLIKIMHIVFVILHYVWAICIFSSGFSQELISAELQKSCQIQLVISRLKQLLHIFTYCTYSYSLRTICLEQSPHWTPPISSLSWTVPPTVALSAPYKYSYLLTFTYRSMPVHCCCFWPLLFVLCPDLFDFLHPVIFQHCYVYSHTDCVLDNINNC